MKTKFNPWPLGIILFFVIFAAFLATAVVIAATHRDNLVSENYYEQELKYQDQIDGKARAAAAGASVAYVAAAGQVVIQLPAGQIAAKPTGKIEFYRPSAQTLDCGFDLAPTSDGSQVLDISQLAAGAWTVHVRWNAGGQNYFLEQKISVRPK
jgi:nitrogen fixation protein FixH